MAVPALGLTISNRLLELMNSKLQLQSAPGLGSTFYFDIALKAEAGEPINWENIDLIKRVLIVDDNQNNRMIVSQMLLLKQIKTVEASNGFEALQLLAKGEQFDAVIMDYHMPYINGLETIQKIRESFDQKEKEIPVILLYSSSDDGTIIKACDDLQVNHRLVKPVKMQDIYNTLSRLYVKNQPIAEAVALPALDTISKELNILIAEDNAVNMLLAKTILSRLLPNAHVTGVGSGIAAVEACKKQWPDLILMDVQMPEMNGYDATRQIRAIQGDRTVPIIALTAGNIKGEKEKCLAAGMDDFAAKPIVENTLSLLFHQWLPDEKTKQPVGPVAAANNPSEHLDIEMLKTYTGDDLEFMRELLNVTRVEMSNSLAAITRQIDSEDLTAIKLSGHRLYGTALSSGLPRLAVIANRIEHLEQFAAAEMRELLDETRLEMNEIFKLIDQGFD